MTCGLAFEKQRQAPSVLCQSLDGWVDGPLEKARLSRLILDNGELDDVRVLWIRFKKYTVNKTHICFFLQYAFLDIVRRTTSKGREWRQHINRLLRAAATLCFSNLHSKDFQVDCLGSVTNFCPMWHSSIIFCLITAGFLSTRRAILPSWISFQVWLTGICRL